MTTHTNETTQHASGLPIDQLGSTIRAHLGNVEKYEGKAHENRLAAGKHLIEAKARIAAGEYEGKFGAFLLKECNALSSSRAYELIALAGGKTTQEAHRQTARARDQAYRDRKTAVVRRPTESATAPQPATPHKAETPRKSTPEQDLIAQIVAACQGQPTEKLQEVLRAAKGGDRVSPVTTLDRSVPDYIWWRDSRNYVNGDRYQGLTKEFSEWKSRENAATVEWIKSQPGYKPPVPSRKEQCEQEIAAEVRWAFDDGAIPELQEVLKYLREHRLERTPVLMVA